MKHRATPDFWYYYRQLPPHIQDLADKCYDLLKQDPYYPSLHFNSPGGKSRALPKGSAVWESRALCVWFILIFYVLL
ncbi:MAG: hypothetical protein F6K01_28945 [Okeania sp. SIO1I7]|nr:hypothetical protein [Okeania sp. SIO1I7]